MHCRFMQYYGYLSYINLIKMGKANKINSIILFSLIAISQNKGIDIDDTIEVYLFSVENGLNPVKEYRKAFFD